MPHQIPPKARRQLKADVQTGVSNPANDPNRFVDPSGEEIRALTWPGHYDVRVVISRGAVKQGDTIGLEIVGKVEPKGLAHKEEIFVGVESKASETINEYIMSVKKFGKAGVVGVHVAYTKQLNIGVVMELGIRFVGVGQAPVAKYWEEFPKQTETGELDPTMMITHQIEFKDFPKGYKIFDEKADIMMEVYVQTRFSNPPAKGTPARQGSGAKCIL